MPLRNPFRRQTETPAPSLRDRAADLSARLASTIRRPEPTTTTVAEPDDVVSLEGAAGLDFAAYTFDEPIKTPIEWAAKFNSPAMAMHIADRTLRMTKPELIAFIRKAGETDAATPEIMFRNLDASQETLEGWGKLLDVARTRYLVGASAACLEPETGDEAAPAEPPPAAPPAEAFTPAPPGLADACLWAVRHRAWIDGELKVSDWSDEHFDTETAKTNAVFTRAINEPSATLREITAKAALALEDFERFTLLPGRKFDDGTRIVHTVLREIVGVGRETSAAGALETAQPRPLDLIAAAGVALPGMSLQDLVALHGVARLLGEVASAVTCQPRSMTGDHFNGAGLLVEQLGEALSRAVEAAARELRTRKPANWIESEQRLAALAVSTIEGDDPAETAAFARELLAKVEA